MVDREFQDAQALHEARHHFVRHQVVKYRLQQVGQPALHAALVHAPQLRGGPGSGVTPRVGFEHCTRRAHAGQALRPPASLATRQGRHMKASRQGERQS